VVIKYRYSKLGRQFRGKNKKNKQTNKSIQNTTQKAKHWTTRTPLENGVRLRCSRRLWCSCSISGGSSSCKSCSKSDDK